MSDGVIGLIDADILVYRCGFAAEKNHYHVRQPAHDITTTLDSSKELKDFRKLCEGEDLEIERERVVQPIDFCLQMVKTSLDAIKDVVGMDSHLYLTGSGNFRKDVATLLPYKGNRSEFDKPLWYQEIREYMQEVHGAQIIDGQEADDEIGIRAYEIKEHSQEKAVVVSIDKDLDMIEGLHYNWETGAKYKIDSRQAIRNFYLQMLTGDRTDNIPGIQGIGPKTAEKVLKDYTKESVLYACVRDEWDKYYPDGYEGKSTNKVLREIGRLLWIRRKRDELWEPPI